MRPSNSMHWFFKYDERLNTEGSTQSPINCVSPVRHVATSPDLVLTRINSSMLELNRDLSD